jgi:DNA-binding response OmpR family regulator
MARILIVNDDEDLVEMCRLLLEAKGHLTNAVIHPERASLLELVRDFQPQLVLLDLVMPDVTGEEVVEWLRSEPDLPSPAILIASALADGPGLVRHLRVDGFLPKPFTAEELSSAVDAILTGDTHPSV